MKRLLSLALAFALALATVAPGFSAFRVNNLVGFGVRVSGPAVVSAFLDGSNSTADLSTYTAVGLTLPGVTGRHVVVGFVAASASSLSFVSGTADGQTLTQLHSHQAGAFGFSVLLIAPSTANATGDISVTLGNTAVRAGLCVWQVQNLQSMTPTDTAQDDAADPSTTIDVLAGGAAFAMAYDGGTASTWAWTGLTEDADVTWDTNRSFSCASDDFAAAQSGLTVTGNHSGAGAATTNMTVVAMR